MVRRDTGQDYLAALWALGLRTPRATDATIETAITDCSVVRLHGFRGTWQYVAREHVRWMLGLIGDRVIASSASRFRELELDHKTLRPFTAPTRSEREALALAAERYGEFPGLETRLRH